MLPPPPQAFTPENLEFQEKVLARSGLGEETYLPECEWQRPVRAAGSGGRTTEGGGCISHLGSGRRASALVGEGQPGWLGGGGSRGGVAVVGGWETERNCSGPQVWARGAGACRMVVLVVGRGTAWRAGRAALPCAHAQLCAADRASPAPRAAAVLSEPPRINMQAAREEAHMVLFTCVEEALK